MPYSSSVSIPTSQYQVVEGKQASKEGRMARLENMLPPGEIIRWKSPKDRKLWTIIGGGMLAGAGTAWFSSMLRDATESGMLLFAAIGMAGIGIVIILFAGLNRTASSKLAVTEAHIVWVGDGDGRLPLYDVVSIDAEEGGATLNLHLDGETRRVEEIGGDVEGAARAAGRPARVWRECKSRGAVLARRWRFYVGITSAGVLGAGAGFLQAEIVQESGWIRAVAGAGAALLLAVFVALAQRTLPHLLAGCRLSGDERRDFIGWMTDLRWQGVKPDGPDDQRLPRSRLEQWAMRLAYGEIPDIGEREPEVLMPGAFPEKS